MRGLEWLEWLVNGSKRSGREPKRKQSNSDFMDYSGWDSPDWPLGDNSSLAS